MLASKQLEQALSLISDEAHWMQKDYAHDADGYPIAPHEDTAVRFCAWGAFHHATNTKYWNPFPESAQYLQQAARDLYNDSIINVNDYMGHAAVIATYQEAIRLAQKAEDQDGKISAGNRPLLSASEGNDNYAG